MKVKVKKMERIIPPEIISLINEYYNPYKKEYSKTVLVLKQKNKFKFLMRQLVSYNLYNVNGELIKFEIDAILG